VLPASAQRTARLLLFAAALAAALPGLRGQGMLQYFNTSWKEITRKMPALAEAGYKSLWLPPPTKGSGGLSVGYDLWDRFDLGSKDQRGSLRTRYGTEADLLRLVETAHRFGIRVYFDNIMNHNAFDVPGFNADTPIDIYPGMVPEDFHLRVTQEGFYRKWDNTRDWLSTWQVQNLGLADLIDIAHEAPNTNFGPNEGDDHPKITFVRQPEHPEYYLDTDLPIEVTNSATGVTFETFTFAHKEPFEDVGYGPDNVGAGNERFDFEDLDGDGQHDADEPSEPFQDLGLYPNMPSRNDDPEYGGGDGVYNMGNPVPEDVNALLIRAARWQLDRTHADGYRLDAVKHVPAYFFGQQSGAGKDASTAGYLGQSQEQFNLTRGFSDWDNHRDSLFNAEQSRDDALMFGEHLGEPPGFGGYIDAGMRLVDNPLRQEFNNRLGNPSAGLDGFDQPGAGGFAPSTTVMHAQSHDSSFAARRALQHAMYFTRAGIGLVYTDGNHHAETLGESGGAFPRHANTAFLGQWGDPRLPNLQYLQNHFGRGEQIGRWSDADFIAYERVDKRENPSMSNADGVTLLFLLNDNFASGQARNFQTSFPATPGGPDSYLYQYATGPDGSGQTGFYAWASDIVGGNVIVPPGGYFAFSWKNPDPSELWPGEPLQIYQNGRRAGTIPVERQDGPDGDPAFNPKGLPDDDPTDFTYTIDIPRVTDGSDLRFVARADGSAENILLKLDGGMDLNGQSHPGGDPRDNPPALSTDVFMGYEQATFAGRIHPELFAAEVTGERDITGSAGAETFIKPAGGNDPVTINQGSGERLVDGDTAGFFYHEPDAPVTGDPQADTEMFRDSGGSIELWAKSDAVGESFEAHVYYTTDGSFPEGAAGQGFGTTQVRPMTREHADDGGGSRWWKADSIPTPSAGKTFRYKIGVHKPGAPSWFPNGPGPVNRKTRMMTTFEVDGFDATSADFRPHSDYGELRTGLSEGFHMIRARAFLKRDGQASIYNTFKQTFYYDTRRPQGEIKFPATDGETVGGSEFGVVARTDASVTSVEYRILDGDPDNNDSATGADNGNGAWAEANEVTPAPAVESDFPREWRFDYVNIPSEGDATIEVRLREVSSAEADDLADAQGHYTTLTRSVRTRGPDVRMFVGFPRNDGEVVGDDFVMKAFFSKTLADGLSEQELLDRFLVRIGSTEPGDDGEVQDPSEYDIVFNETERFHALAYDLPNLFNDRPDFRHKITVTHTRPAAPKLTATRLVRAAPSETPFLAISNPPEFGPDGRPFEIVLPDVAAPDPEDRRFEIQVDSGPDVERVDLAFAGQGAGTLEPDPDNPKVEGNDKSWAFSWRDMREGRFRLRAEADTGDGGDPENVVLRDTTVVFREKVANDPDDADDDDDGLTDGDEGELTPLPNGWPDDDPRFKPNAEQWTNGEVHIHFAFGMSDPLSPDSDGDGLPDGLEVGWRAATHEDTDPAADTDDDGFKNFIGDLDPPFYNTLDNEGRVPGVDSAAEGGDRAARRAGSMTAPNDPDTDGDGLPDGVEDANRNGWVDGDGEPLEPGAAPSLERAWPDGEMDPGETWTETDPNNPDTDGDGLSDGFGEDKNLDGVIDGDLNGDRAHDAGEAWTETDPLNDDTDGDGLPDGWEVDNGLDPLDDGTDSFRTAESGDGDPAQGASGDPDGDGFTNLQELTNGTDPRRDETVDPPDADSIVIGPGETTSVGQITHRNEFTDWELDDLIVLDEYEGDGINNQSGDIHPAFDGFDSSRDMVAFYFRDGGTDGRLYFRVDFHDLRAFAEEEALDVYVVIDSGNPANGEFTLPDEVDTGTEMGWEAVIAAYGANKGAVLVDTDNGNNSTSINQDLARFGVERRDQNAPNGFGRSHYNANLDAVEFSISRQALVDAGWNGDADRLNFQVITTKDGTQNDGTGAGDLGGRTDIRDSIFDDNLAEDHFRSQRFIANNSVLTAWFGRDASNDRGKRAKMIALVHENQAVRPGDFIQNKINDGEGAGYFRALDAHEAYGQPLALHVTPTLASAVQWAAADPAAGKPWRDGPAFNDRIGRMAADGQVELLGSAFADHAMPYFPREFHESNERLARDFLGDIYGTAPSDTVFWTPERLADDEVLAEVANLGYDYTFVDQMRHIFKWFGRTEALGESGFRVQEINGTRAFVIHETASEFRFRNTDGGLALPLRNLLSRKARSGTQDQVVVLFSDWSDFGDPANAAAYDRNIAWLASRPWVQLTTPGAIARGEVDLSRPPDGEGDAWGAVDRGDGLDLPLVAQNFIDHATQQNYDNWYFGSQYEQGLEPTTFDIRPGQPLPRKFGRVGEDGAADAAWNAFQNVNLLQDRQRDNAASVLHGASFQTAFHQSTNNDLRTFSTGDYINPDRDGGQQLADFAARAQSQARFAALYERAAQWADNVATYDAPAAESADVDLDGEDEHLLFNDRVFAIFEALGGRLKAAWARDIESGEIYQTAGNFLAFSGSSTEAVDGAFRAFGFTDEGRANDVYSVAPASEGAGWTFTSPDGRIRKTMTLAPRSSRLEAAYDVDGEAGEITTRFGLSPHLGDLFRHGQRRLSSLTVDGDEATVQNEAPGATVRAFVEMDGAAYQAPASDDRDTVPARNKAQTQELAVAGSGSFTLRLGFQTGLTLDYDGDGDGLVDAFAERHNLAATSEPGPSGNPDGDAFDNLGEQILGTDPTEPASFETVAETSPGQFKLTVPTVLDRRYQLFFSEDLRDWQPLGDPVLGTGQPVDFIDDGAATDGAPGTDDDRRFYQIEVRGP